MQVQSAQFWTGSGEGLVSFGRVRGIIQHTRFLNVFNMSMLEQTGVMTSSGSRFGPYADTEPCLVTGSSVRYGEEDLRLYCSPRDGGLFYASAEMQEGIDGIAQNLIDLFYCRRNGPTWFGTFTWAPGLGSKACCPGAGKNLTSMP